MSLGLGLGLGLSVGLTTLARFVQSLFAGGDRVGWAHWFDNPDDLYRRRNVLTQTQTLSTVVLGNITRTAAASSAPDGTPATRLAVTSSSTNTVAHLAASRAATAATARFFFTVRRVSGVSGTRFLIRNNTSASDGDLIAVNYATGAVSGSGSTTQGTSHDLGGGWYLVVLTRTAGINLGDTLQVYFGWLGDAAVTAGDSIDFTKAQLDFGGTDTSLAAVSTSYQAVTDWYTEYIAAVGAERIFAWQDSAGTTPVTAVGQTIGLSLDRAYGGMRGEELVTNGNFASGAANWTTVVTGGNAITIGGGAVRFQTTGADTALLTQAVTLGAGKVFAVEFDVLPGSSGQLKLVPLGGPPGEVAFSCTPGKKVLCSPVLSTNSFVVSRVVGQVADATLTNFSVREIPGTHLIQATSTSRPTLSAQVNMLLNSATMSTQNVTTIAASYKLSFTGTGTVTLSGTSTAGPLVGTGANDRVSLTFTPTAGTLTLTVSGSVTLADLRTADDAAKNIPAYQRVGATAADHDTDGFPHFALLDGSDDSWASAATVDGSGSDKVTVVTGVTKNSDAAAGIICELTASTAANNGAFLLLASGIYSGGDRLTYAVETRGTTSALTREMRPFTAPHSAVVSVSNDNGANTITATVNAAVPGGSSANSTSAGNYANATLYVGSRAGASIRLNGRVYALIGRFGAMSDTERNRLGAWVKNLMRLS